MTVGELYEGIYFGRDPQRSEAVFREVLRAVDVLSLNLTIMRRFARIRGELRQRGLLIGDPDLLTRNLRHFQHIPGLKAVPAAALTVATSFLGQDRRGARWPRRVITMVDS